MDEIRIRANGLRFGALTAGDGDETALLLHGFPDTPHSMRPLMERLADAGYETVAPWMRGYRPTDIPSDGDYQIAALASDVIGLLDALDWSDTLLLGHDWGAVAGYAATAKAPGRIREFVSLSIPPLRLFLRNALRSPAQWRRSWYMFAFQMPMAPERWLSRDDFELLERIWHGVSSGAARWGRAIEEAKRTFRQPGTLEAALGYYRALNPLHGGPPGGLAESWELTSRRIRRPTLMVAGAEDPAIGLELFDDLGEAFEAPWELEVLDDGGHFIQLEQPDLIADRVLGFAESR